MDYLNNSVSNLNAVDGNNQFKIFTNLNLENISSNSQLKQQIETLKDKLKVREEEIFDLIKTQKEEYERIAKEKDFEISNLVEKLVSENEEFKMQVLNSEIEKEYYKETLNDYKIIIKKETIDLN